MFSKNCYFNHYFLNKICIEDTHRRNAASNKFKALTRRMKMDIWVVSSLNQLFIRGTYSNIKFSKKK